MRVVLNSKCGISNSVIAGTLHSAEGADHDGGLNMGGSAPATATMLSSVHDGTAVSIATAMDEVEVEAEIEAGPEPSRSVNLATIPIPLEGGVGLRNSTAQT